MKQTLQLNDALYNAGLLGFVRVMQRMKIPLDNDRGTSLTVDLSMFENGTFTKAYLDELCDRYQSQTKYDRLMQELEPYTRENLEIPDKKDEKYKKWVTSVKTKLESASYKAAYEIIAQDEQSPFDFRPLIQEWKSSKEPAQKIACVPELYERLKQYGRIFVLKDIVYNFVQPYWGGIAFLNKTKNKDPFEQTFEQEFIQPILAYKAKKGKKVYHCLQCAAALPGAPTGASMSWLEDVGIDIKRKSNGFWDFNIDLAPCPLCKLVYACIPIGFCSMAYEGVFINSNTSFRQLNSLNDLKPRDMTKGSLATIINLFIGQTNEREAESKLKNIQVVRRSRNEKGNWEYRVNILSAELLEKFTQCKTTLEQLIEINPRLHRQVIDEILEGKNLYPLLYRQYREALSKKYSLGIYFPVLCIQITMFAEREEKTMTEKYLKYVKSEGGRLQEKIKNRINGKNTITLSYGLLNALQAGDKNRFLQLVMRQYLSLGLPIPDLFIEMIADDEQFRAIGNAFLIGLNQKSKTEDNKAENDEKEKEA